MKQYALTKEGISNFLDSVLSDVLDNGIYNPIQITIGSHSIKADLYPETYEALETMLHKSLEIIEEEYNDD